MPVPDPYAELRRIARRRSQRGCFTTVQAEDAGLSPVQLHRLAQRGLIVLAAPRVYRFAIAAAPDWKVKLAAALLSTDGIACGLSAAALYSLAAPPSPAHVLVARGSRVGIAGQHTTRTLLRTEQATVDGLRALAPIRMVLDSTFRLPRARAVELVESSIVRGLVGPIALERRARELRHAKRPGCAITLSVLSRLHPELTRARNEWEALVIRRARAFGLDAPSLQFEIVVEGRRYLADAAWGDALVLLEFDGRDPHMRRRVHDHDSIRRNDLTSAGWLRFGVTADALRQGDDRVFRQVAAALARRRGFAG